MTLRARLALLTSVAVALAVVAASLAAWWLIRTTLMDDIDERLLARAPDGDAILAPSIEVTDARPAVDADGSDADGSVADELAPRTVIRRGAETTGAEDTDDGADSGGDSASSTDDDTRFVLAIQNEPVGVQVIDPDGTVTPRLPPGDIAFDLSSGERQLLDGDTTEPQLRTETVDGTSYRMMSAVVGTGHVLRLVQPLDDVEATMSRIRWLLAGVASAGIAGAGGLGWLITRAGLRPVHRLTDAAEQVASTTDLTHRIDVPRRQRGEVARLAASVNAMLTALDSARTQQRQLVEDAAHELRTPLTTLRNDVGLLLRAEQHPERTLDADDRESLLRELESEVDALSDLVGEIVDLARGDAEPEPVILTDLGDLVNRAATRAGRLDPGVDVTVEGPRIEAPVRPAMLERAVTNLLRNAVQVSDGSTPVEIVLLQGDDGEIAIHVLDRGPGIADEDLPRLFDRFYRGQGSRRRHGSGLGLAIVAQAAAQHGGTVAACNRDGGGAVFTVRIPAQLRDESPPT